ncbi:hypothetical protein KDW82_10615 [Burkholderia vietnamiensis]|uniref:hypothetical protein n=1 Tax=Burkholderia vietnamiensis TaxID=60552 RepID=UPI001B9726AD|nr:hypothetical protein [Burkholderia vietnamiensis]MBR8189508.1 hypothetical protein [Burkholderia vietnamiensis]
MDNHHNNDPLIPIITAIYNSLGKTEKDKVIAEISVHLRVLNADFKTRGTNGATQVADMAKKITGKEYKLGNGFD